MGSHSCDLGDVPVAEQLLWGDPGPRLRETGKVPRMT